jgi:hypothetical protein
MRKSTLLALLVCVNMALLTAIVLRTYSPPAAYAQGTGLGGNYVMVAGEIQDGYDALYLIDTQSRYLHALYYDRGTNSLRHGGYRSLRRDFRNEAEGGRP